MILLLTMCSASVCAAQNTSIISFLTNQEMSCVATGEWGAYFDGMLGGGCLALLVTLPIVWRYKSNGKIRGMDE